MKLDSDFGCIRTGIDRKNVILTLGSIDSDFKITNNDLYFQKLNFWNLIQISDASASESTQKNVILTSGSIDSDFKITNNVPYFPKLNFWNLIPISDASAPESTEKMLFWRRAQSIQILKLRIMNHTSKNLISETWGIFDPWSKTKIFDIYFWFKSPYLH